MITESARVEELPLVLPLRPPDFWNPTFIATFVCLLLNAAIPAASLALLWSRGIESEGLLWLFFADLALPAVEGGAVVGDLEAIARHGRRQWPKRFRVASMPWSAK